MDWIIVAIATVSCVQVSRAFLRYYWTLETTDPNGVAWAIFGFQSTVGTLVLWSTMFDGELTVFRFIIIAQFMISATGNFSISVALWRRDHMRSPNLPEKMAFGASIVVLLIWVFAREQELLATILMVATSAAGFVLSYRKLYQKADGETTRCWLWWASGYGCTAINVALTQGLWTIASINPVAQAILHAGVAGFCYRKRRDRSQRRGRKKALPWWLVKPYRAMRRLLSGCLRRNDDQ